MLLTRIDWDKRVWALPFLTALAPSERYYGDKPHPHKTLTDWARQLLLQVKRWVGDRQVIAVGDRTYAVIDLLSTLQGQVALITRLRLDAALYEPVPLRAAGQKGRTRLKGKRLPTLAQLAADASTDWQALCVANWYGGGSEMIEYCTQTALWYHSGKQPVSIRWVLIRWKDKCSAFVSNDPQLSAPAMIEYFVRRWSMEVTFAQVRAHLGVETQRQWSQKAIARTTPILLGLFSMVTLLADRLWQKGLLLKQESSWYEKAHFTFADALASVRMLIWEEMIFYTSHLEAQCVKIPKHLLLLWQSTLAWAA